jgi:hypothetical protein
MEATLPRDAAQLHGEPPAEAPVDAADTPETVARDTNDRAADGVRYPIRAMPSARPLREAFGRFMLSAGKHLATLGIALVAVVISVATWQHYVTAPWTRNGSVRVQVANVAPQVAGKIVELRVADNQFVHKGDVLYVIDPFDFEVAVGVDKALVQQRAADLEVKQAEFNRRQHLSDLATTPEEQQIFAGNAAQAKAAYEAATHQLAQAELNLKRTSVTSPVDGYVRIAIDTVPPDVPLVSGMTATVTIRQPSADHRQTWFGQFRENFVDPVTDLFGAGQPPRPNCLQATSQQRPEVEAVPYTRESAVPPAETIAPGLTPGINASPRLP